MVISRICIFVDHLFITSIGQGRTGHDAGAQAGEVELVELRMLQLGDEHGGDAVERGAALLLMVCSTFSGSKSPPVDHGGAVGDAGEIPQDHAEAVEEAAPGCRAGPFR